MKIISNTERKRKLTSWITYSARKLRVTKQRTAILDIIKQSHDRLTAHEIAGQTKIGLATVYRNLEILCDTDVIEKAKILHIRNRATYEMMPDFEVIFETK